MSKPTKLKPCPHCGGEAARYKRKLRRRLPDTQIWETLINEGGVRCEKCGACVRRDLSLVMDEQRALGHTVRKWNRRPK